MRGNASLYYTHRKGVEVSSCHPAKSHRLGICCLFREDNFDGSSLPILGESGELFANDNGLHVPRFSPPHDEGLVLLFFQEKRLSRQGCHSSIALLLTAVPLGKVGEREVMRTSASASFQLLIFLAERSLLVFRMK